MLFVGGKRYDLILMSETSPSPSEQPGVKCCRNLWMAGLIVSIVGIFLPQLIGFLITEQKMRTAFDTAVKLGPDSLGALSDDISQAVKPMDYALWITLSFFGLFVITLVKVLSNRDRK